MRNGIRRRQYLRVSAAMLVSCVVCALAWWWYRSLVWWNPTGIKPIYNWRSTLSELLNLPGWLVVIMFDPTESPLPLATKLTDTLIPILSGLFWTLLALLLVKLWRIGRDYVHKPAKSR
jgi:hypothetical protein